MRNTSKPATTLTLSPTPRRHLAAWTRLALIAGAVAAAALFNASRVDAASALCASGASCNDATQSQPYKYRSAPGVEALTGVPMVTRSPALSDQEYLSFSGVGAVVCTVHGKQRMSTAFLVGAFDIGVTVAHTFEQDGEWASPENCVYTSTDSLGQVRERIPVSYIKAQWESEEGAFGQPAKDFAVIRLREPSRFAQRTMALGKFAGPAASVVMVGFNGNLEGDTVKRKTRGTVYERKVNGIAISSMAGFTHDMDSRDIASGAPVIDENTGVIIGVHTQWTHAATATAKAASRNTMIAMNDWLERTLRSEMMAARTAAVER